MSDLEYAPTSAQSHGTFSRLHRAFRKIYGTIPGKVLLLVAFLVALVLIFGAILEFAFTDFDNYPSSLWWGVKHLIDPSQIGEDEGVGERVAGLVLVIVGLVVVLGVIFDGIATAVDRNVSRRETHQEPLDTKGHLVFTGWTDSLPKIIAYVRLRYRVAGLPDGHFVIIVDNDLRPERDAILATLREVVPGRTPDVVFAESGGTNGFDLASCQTARSIVLVSDHQGGHDARAIDIGTVESAIALGNYLDDRVPAGMHMPAVFMSFIESRTASASYHLLGENVMPLLWDRIIASMVAVLLPDHLWSAWSLRLIGYGDDPGDLFSVSAGELAGLAFRDLDSHFEEAIPIGIVTPLHDEAPNQPLNTTAVVAPGPDRILEPHESILLITPVRRMVPTPRHEAPSTPKRVALGSFRSATIAPRTVAMVGFNRHTAVILERLAAYPQGSMRVEFLAPDSSDFSASLPDKVRRILDLSFHDGDPTKSCTIERFVEDAAPDVALVTSVDSGLASADADALMAGFHLRRVCDIPVYELLNVPEDAAALDTVDGLYVIPVPRMKGLFVAALSEDPAQGRLFQSLFALAAYHMLTVPFAPEDGRAHPFASVYQSMIEHDCVVVATQRPSVDGGDPDSSVNFAPARDHVVQPGDLLLAFKTTRDYDPELIMRSLREEGSVKPAYEYWGSASPVEELS